MRTFALLILLTGAGMVSVQLNYFNAEREGSAIIVTWEAEVEEDVRAYELFRRSSFAGEFTEIASSGPLGVGRQYLVRDDQVYKDAAELVDYRLEVVFTNGLRQRLAEKKVNYTPTAIRRSWGSIKAMFQD